MKNIKVKENDPALQNALLAIAERSVQRNIAFFKSRSIFLVDSKKIQKSALNQFPEIETLQVKRNFPNTLFLVTQKRKEVALWCQTQDVCFALDGKGIIFEEKKPQGEFVIADLQKNPLPVLSTDGLKLGEVVVPQDVLAPLLDFRNRVEKLDVFSNATTTFASASLVSDLQIHYKTSKGWEVYMNPKENIDWQITKLQTVLAQKIPSGKRARLDYIDLRFGDQAYVKYQN